jgi:tryptophanyl-tRNA synthetase
MSIKMDSRPPEEPKPDAEQNIALQLLKLVAPADIAREQTERLRAGGLGYGTLKKTLFEQYWNYFAAARARRAELAANLDYIQQVLGEGADKARTLDDNGSGLGLSIASRIVELHVVAGSHRTNFP